MERIRLQVLASCTASLLLAATLASAANVAAGDALVKKFFGDAAPAAASVAPPAAAPKPAAPTPAPVTASADRAHPDWAYTPGKLCTTSDPDFKEYRYAENIPYCNRHVTKDMKQQIGAHYGIAESDWRSYEFDHLIPLSLGGNSHVENLWPEPNADNQGPSGKDQLELQLYLQIRDGKITQAEAVKQIYAWFNVNHPEMTAQLAAAQGK